MEDLGGKAGISSPKMGIFHHRSFVPSESAFGDRKGYFYPPKKPFWVPPNHPRPQMGPFWTQNGLVFFFLPVLKWVLFAPNGAAAPKWRTAAPQPHLCS